jgi:hypothetical protein
MRNEPVTVATYSSAIEANAVRNFLGKNGIQAVVADEYISDLGHSTLSRVKLQVSRLNAERARELLGPSGSRRFDARG